MEEKTLYLVHKQRGYRIKVTGDTARIERQAHNGFQAESQRAYLFPYILEDGIYWDYVWCERLIKRYETDITRSEERARAKATREAATGIRHVITKMMRDRPDTFEAGYQIAEALKASGYTYEQVSPVAAQVCTVNVRSGIQIKYTGLYD